MDLFWPIIICMICLILFSICGWCCRSKKEGTVYGYGTNVTVVPPPVVNNPYPPHNQMPMGPGGPPQAGFVQMPMPHGPTATPRPYPVQTYSFSNITPPHYAGIISVYNMPQHSNSHAQGYYPPQPIGPHPTHPYPPGPGVTPYPPGGPAPYPPSSFGSEPPPYHVAVTQPPTHNPTATEAYGKQAPYNPSYNS